MASGICMGVVHQTDIRKATVGSSKRVIGDADELSQACSYSRCAAAGVDMAWKAPGNSAID